MRSRAVEVTPQTVTRCLERAAELGVLEAPDDRPRAGRDPVITPEARTWLVALACQKPKELGYPHELWTTRLLAAHARDHGPSAGLPQSGQIGPRDGLQDPRGPRGQAAQGALLPGAARSGIRAQDGGNPVRLSSSRGAARARAERGERWGGDGRESSPMTRNPASRRSARRPQIFRHCPVAAQR